MAGHESSIDIAKDAHRGCLAAKVGHSNPNPPITRSPDRAGTLIELPQRFGATAFGVLTAGANRFRDVVRDFRTKSGSA
jgi:hypothetical protein